MEQRKTGRFIAARRRELGWTQSQLAEKLGVTDKAVSKWETGRSMPDLSLFEPLCALLKITLNELLLGEKIPDGRLKEKSDQLLLELLTGWLGGGRREMRGRPEEPPVLRLKNVRKIYQSEKLSMTAVRDVSLTVERGSFIGIMGASGSGKSTLLNLAAAMDRANGGTVEIEGREISSLSEKELAAFRRDRLGFIFQEYNLLDSLTLYENIALALTMKRLPKKEIKSAVASWAGRLDILDVLEKFPYEVSGGQRQRCACARAMATAPSLILADEPTGALDSRSARMLLEQLERLSRDCQTAILMVTHDALSASYCSRIYFMQDGEFCGCLSRRQENRREFFARILEMMAKTAGGLS